MQVFCIAMHYYEGTDVTTVVHYPALKLIVPFVGLPHKQLSETAFTCTITGLHKTADHCLSLHCPSTAHTLC